jgi:hypothetical protein
MYHHDIKYFDFSFEKLEYNKRGNTKSKESFYILYFLYFLNEIKFCLI